MKPWFCGIHFCYRAVPAHCTPDQFRIPDQDVDHFVGYRLDGPDHRGCGLRSHFADFGNVLVEKAVIEAMKLERCINSGELRCRFELRRELAEHITARRVEASVVDAPFVQPLEDIEGEVNALDSRIRAGKQADRQRPATGCEHESRTGALRQSGLHTK